MFESPYLTVPHRSEWGNISPGSILISWPKSKVNTISVELSNDRVSTIFSLFAKFYTTISTEMFLKPFIEAVIWKISKH